MVVTCPACGCASRDLEFCDNCNNDLMPAAVALPPAVCLLGPEESVSLTPEQARGLSRPEAAVTMEAGGRCLRLHWIPGADWPGWRENVERRQALHNPALAPCRVIEAHEGVWVAAEAARSAPVPWLAPTGQEPLESLRKLADSLGPLSESLEALHADGLVWLTFDPRELEEEDGRLRFTNLDLAVYPQGHCPDKLLLVPAFAAPEVSRFREQAVGPRTDVFHLALFAFYWLARRLPRGLAGKGLEASGFVLPPLRTYAPQLPPGVAAVVSRGLATDPEARHATPAALVDDLRAALERAERRWASTTPVRWEVGQHTRAGRAKQALGRPNQDSVLIRAFSAPERVLAAVADGITSCDVGHGTLASLLTCVVLDNAIGPDCTAETFPGQIEAACRHGAESLLSWALERGEGGKLAAGKDLMGTTLTAAWLEGNRLTLANLGDSRAYLIHEAGIDPLTVDGDLATTLLAANVPPEDVLELGAHGRALHSCVGGCSRLTAGGPAIDPERCKPALSNWPLLPGDVVVLCTDGLVEERAFLEPGELAELVRRHADLPAEELAVKLAEEADARQRPPSPGEPEGFGDNISCVIIKVM
jgi:protein phosphatase